MVRIEVTYKIPEGIDMELDRVILDKMDEIKAEWYAQGIDKETGIRDLCFDLDGKR